MDSHRQPLTPYEQRLRDEVIFLHSLWHRGPPPPPPPPPPFSIPISNPYRPDRFTHYTNNPTRNLRVFNPPSFKKTKRNPRHTPGNASNFKPDPGPEWPVDPLPPPQSSPPADSGWISFQEIPTAETRKLSEVDESKVAMMRLQQNVMNICDDYFAKRADSDGEEDDEFFGEDIEDDSVGVEESEEFKFYFGLFVENRELRDFYENNKDNGGFYCLVCGRVGKPGGKRFRDCHGLVQHANNILKTKRRRAHRAFGLTICRVLGWDITRLPTIVLKGQPLSQSLANLGQTLNSLKEDDSKKVAEDQDIDNRACVTQESQVMNTVENSLKEDDSKKVAEDQDIDNRACATQESKVVNTVENGLKEKEDDSGKESEDIGNGACVAQERKVVDIVEGEPKAKDDNGDDALESAKD